MYQISWSHPVLNRLVLLRDHRVEYLANYSLGFLKQLTEATSPLADTPERGRLVFETDYQRTIRELVFKDFRIIYRINSNQIDTVAIIRARKNIIGLAPIRSRIKPALF